MKFVTCSLSEITNKKRRNHNVSRKEEIEAIVDAVTSVWPDHSCYELTYTHGVSQDDQNFIAELIHDYQMDCGPEECLSALKKHVADQVARILDEEDGTVQCNHCGEMVPRTCLGYCRDCAE